VAIAAASFVNLVVGGRALIRSEPYRKDDAYEYIRGIFNNINRCVINCFNSEYEK
jgi:hypothetical protein